MKIHRCFLALVESGVFLALTRVTVLYTSVKLECYSLRPSHIRGNINSKL